MMPYVESVMGNWWEARLIMDFHAPAATTPTVPIPPVLRPDATQPCKVFILKSPPHPRMDTPTPGQRFVEVPIVILLPQQLRITAFPYMDRPMHRFLAWFVMMPAV